MSPLHVLWLLLAAFGLAAVLGHSRITLSFRILLAGSKPGEPELKPLIPVVGPWFIELIECPMCLGVWEGFWFVVLQDYSALGAAVLAGCAVAGSNFILGRVTRLI